jgi:branched-chain amino acid transport system ATP-binding protein
MSDLADLPVTLDPEAPLPEPSTVVKVAAVLLFVMGAATTLAAIPLFGFGLSTLFGDDEDAILIGLGVFMLSIVQGAVGVFEIFLGRGLLRLERLARDRAVSLMAVLITLAGLHMVVRLSQDVSVVNGLALALAEAALPIAVCVLLTIADESFVRHRVTTRARVEPGVLADTAPEPGVAKPDPILIVDGIQRRFGGLTAVDVDHLEIQRGVITGLIGPNGAGKTTLFNLLTGFDEPNEGQWEFNGQQLSGAVAHQVATKGMVRTFQLTKALSKMTVLDNMMLGGTGQVGERFVSAFLPTRWKAQEDELRDRAHELLARFGIDHMADEYAGTLSGGQRKLLEMARALMTEPELVMLDEPMAGVNPALTQSLLGHVKGLRDEGMTVIFVEHDMDVVRDISDWVVVMAEGSIIAEGTHDDITGNPEVIDAYLGTSHGESAAEGPATQAHKAGAVVEAREELIEALEELADE